MPKNSSAAWDSVIGANLAHRIAGPRGMGPSAGLFVLLPLTLGSLVSDPARAQVSFATLALIVIRSGFLAWLAFVLLGYLIGLVTRKHEFLRATLFMIFYVAIEVFRTVFIALNIQAIDPTLDINWPYRVTAGGLTGLTLFTLAAVVMNDTRDFRLISVKLHESQDLILHNVSLTEREFAFRRDETLSGVRGIVENALREVASRSSTNPDAVKRTIAELVRVSDTVIRPLSHELFEMPETFLESTVSKTRVKFFRAMQLTTLEKPFRPELTFVLVFLMIVGAAFFSSPSVLVGISQLALLSGSVFCVMWLARRFLLPWIRTCTFGVRVIVINLVYAGYSVGLGAIVSFAYVREVNALASVYAAVIGMVVFGFLAFIPGLEAARREVLDELESKNQQLLWLNARLGARLWAERKVIARTLHRDVQGVLVAAAFRLERAIDSGERVDEAVAEVRELIELAAGFVVQPPTHPRAQAILDQLLAQWAGVLEIAMHWTDETRELLDNDQVARQAFSDICAEFLTNSVKHGRASQVTLRVSVDEGQRLLLIDGYNNGVPFSETSLQQGLGGKMLASISLEMRFTNAPQGGVELAVSLPVSL